MKPAIDIAGAQVFLGDCRDVLKTLPDNSVDSIVTDPPYELNFMQRKWDNTGVAYDVTVWQECLRVLKPGGHILAFGGSRTWHRLAVAVEDAGFELRDSIAWIYGSGFPKSLDVSKAIDKKAGIWRGKAGAVTSANGSMNSGNYERTEKGAPATSEAQQWSGWGTALKPAFEPVVVGRKPLVGTVAENVLAWGVGGLNIDGSRIGTNPGYKYRADKNGTTFHGKQGERIEQTAEKAGKEFLESTQGRWPANVILDEVTAGLLDEQSGVSKSSPFTNPVNGRNGGIMGEAAPRKDAGKTFDHKDTGGASRFFYVAKASKRDRNEGLEELEEREFSDKKKQNHFATICGKHHTQRDVCKCEHVQMVKNFHPTVKPTQLMRYLIKLVTPAGGTVLDPFTGSGSTGKAALLDGYKFIGAELTEEYLPIIEGRLAWATRQQHEGTLF